MEDRSSEDSGSGGQQFMEGPGVSEAGCSGGWIVKKLKRFDWREEQQLPSGWSFKINRRLKMVDWKERQEFPPGWNVESSRRLKVFDWKDRQELSSGWSFKLWEAEGVSVGSERKGSL